MTAYEINDGHGVVATVHVDSLELSSETNTMYATRLVMANGAVAWSPEYVDRRELERVRAQQDREHIGKLQAEYAELNGQLIKEQAKSTRLMADYERATATNAELNGQLRQFGEGMASQAQAMQAQIDDLEGVLKRQNKNNAGLHRTIDAMDDEIEGLKADLKRATDEVSALVDADVRDADSRIDVINQLNEWNADLTRRIEGQETAIQTLDRQVNELTRERDGVAERLKDVEAMRAGGLRTIRQLHEELDRTKSERNRARDRADAAGERKQELEGQLEHLRGRMKSLRADLAEAGELLANRTLDNRDLKRLLSRAGELIKASAAAYHGHPDAPRIQQMLTWLEDADAFRRGERSEREDAACAEIVQRALTVLIDIRLYWPLDVDGFSPALRDQVEMVIDQASKQLARYSPRAGVTGERDDRSANTGYDVPSDAHTSEAIRSFERGSIGRITDVPLSMDDEPIGHITNVQENADGITWTASATGSKSAHEALQRVTGAAEQASSIDDREWRVGGNYGIHVYAINEDEKDEPVATALKASFARQIVEEHKAAQRRRKEAFGGH